jgi:hypothetical protein
MIRLRHFIPTALLLNLLMVCGIVLSLTAFALAQDREAEETKRGPTSTSAGKRRARTEEKEKKRIWKTGKSEERPDWKLRKNEEKPNGSSEGTTER